MKNFLIKIKHCQSGQAMVETLLVIIFMTIIFFAAIQFFLVAVYWLRANEAAHSVLRCSIVSKGSTIAGADGQNPQNSATVAANLIFFGDTIAIAKLWDKDPYGVSGIDHSSGNNAQGAIVRTFGAHIYYAQKLMFGSMFGRLSSGLGSTQFLSVSNRSGLPSGAAHSRMVKSPDWRYYNKAYPQAEEF
jgi:hypothetical protein